MNLIIPGLFGAAGAALAYAVICRYLPKLEKDIRAEDPSDVPTKLYAENKKFFAILMTASAFAGCFICAKSLEGAWAVENLPVLLRIVVCLAVLTVTAVTDASLYRIPNRIVFVMLCGGIIASVLCFFYPNRNGVSILLGNLLSAAVAFLFFYIMNRITKGGLGMGDVKQFTAMGFLCGIRMLSYTTVFAFFICAAVSAVLLVARRKKIRDGLPLGPFVWVGFVITIALGIC